MKAKDALEYETQEEEHADAYAAPDPVVWLVLCL